MAFSTVHGSNRLLRRLISTSSGPSTSAVWSASTHDPGAAFYATQSDQGVPDLKNAYQKSIDQSLTDSTKSDAGSLRRSPYWRSIPRWRNVDEGDFLKYSWQVSVASRAMSPSRLTAELLPDQEHHPNQRQTHTLPPRSSSRVSSSTGRLQD